MKVVDKQIKKLYEEAIRHQRAALEASPGHDLFREFLSKHYLGLGNVYKERGNDRQAETSCARILEVYPNVLEIPALTIQSAVARLLASSVAEVQRDRLSAAAGYARSNHVVIVLKGAATVVCAEERTAFNLSGNPGMASAGMGDVLAGVIGTLQAQISDSFEAAAAGVFLHGLAGDRMEAALGNCGYLASELGPRFEPPQLLVDMVERGELGKKSGQGFYDWTE